ncbi:hypothetical protein LJR289_004281 [Pseudoduganella sp. LjRoot289]|uniref:hypothetical protein n=1 Tax=Pseudoduganella sp. LjRoot289 TaxID=3342314 RepID=UPI003ECE1BB5
MKISLLTLFIACGVGMSFSACVEPVCENQVLREISSPDGKKIATLFSRNCGATTSHVQVVKIRRSGTNFSGENPTTYIFTMRGEHKVDIRWLAGDQLQITRPQYADDIFHEVNVWDGSKISYAPK